jgi:hypothetical protein
LLLAPEDRGVAGGDPLRDELRTWLPASAVRLSIEFLVSFIISARISDREALKIRIMSMEYKG